MGPMLLWTRTRQLDGLGGPEASAAAVEVAQHSGSITGLEVVPWASVYGLPLGTVVYSVQVESQSAIAAALTTVAESGGTFDDGPAEDAIADLVSTAGSGEST